MNGNHKMSVRQACNLLKQSSSVFYYKPKLKDDQEIIDQLDHLAEEHVRWGFWMMFHHIRNRGFKWRGKPDRIRVDNGPEFIAQQMERYCGENNIDLKFIQKGKPSQNGYIERFNRSYREEVLNAYLFDSLEQVREITYLWMWKYNNERPHDSLMNLPPTQFLLKYGKLDEFPTFQQDINYKKTIFLNVAN